MRGFHWNIQQAADQGVYILDIVFDEIKRGILDFGVITKYSKDAENRYEFETAIEGLNYNTYCTNAPKGQNNVLICVHKRYESG